MEEEYKHWEPLDNKRPISSANRPSDLVDWKHGHNLKKVNEEDEFEKEAMRNLAQALYEWL